MIMCRLLSCVLSSLLCIFTTVVPTLLCVRWTGDRSAITAINKHLSWHNVTMFKDNYLHHNSWDLVSLSLVHASIHITSLFRILCPSESLCDMMLLSCCLLLFSVCWHVLYSQSHTTGQREPLFCQSRSSCVLFSWWTWDSEHTVVVVVALLGSVIDVVQCDVRA